MKAKRLVPGEMVNPHFSNEAKRAHKERGEVYDVVPFLTLPAGEIVDDLDCWKLCLGEKPVMAPADDECRAKVLEAMGSTKRLAFLRNLARQNQPEVRKQMGKSQLEWLDSMIETYGAEIEALDAKPAAPKPVPANEPTPVVSAAQAPAVTAEVAAEETES